MHITSYFTTLLLAALVSTAHVYGKQDTLNQTDLTATLAPQLSAGAQIIFSSYVIDWEEATTWWSAYAGVVVKIANEGNVRTTIITP